ncbi:MAG: protein-disulfide reductase DsbD [Gammaproteobacteria bacterium]
MSPTRWLVALSLVIALPATATPFADVVSRSDPFARFLPVEQAFHVDARAVDANTIAVRWISADAYYLYRHRLGFKVIAPDGITPGDVALPDGQQHTDEFFGDVEVYYGEFEARLPIFRENRDTVDVTLELAYQGCADAGLCYPPDTRTVTVRVPGGPAAPADLTTSVSEPVFLSEQDRLAGLLADGRLWLVVLTFYGLGLLLTFTPCVLPMVPILSAIIVGQGPTLSAARGFVLSLVYVLAMAATYTAAGVFAALAGANLQAVFQHPAVIIVFSVLFVLLAFAMFGAYRFEMPAAIQSKLAAWSQRQRGGTFVGVAVMGLLSALIVGPCVAAPLAGALIYIGQTGDAVLGGTALFAMSLGMGTLLLVIGASAGKLVPRAGPWMKQVNAAFGMLLLAVAIWLIARIIPPAVELALWAALAFAVAVFLGALEPLPLGTPAWRRIAKAFGLALTAWGILLLIGAASGGRDPLQPLAGTALFGEARTELPFQRIKTVDDLDREVVAANDAGKTVMLDFYADWCVSCIQMERDTFTDESVQAALANTVWLQADVTGNDADDKALMRRFGILGPPSIVFYDREGRELTQFRTVGFVPPKDFAAMLELALK